LFPQQSTAPEHINKNTANMADKLYISETPDEVKVGKSSHHCKPEQY
jgi:hypothetical protein